jgi:hypothetical protein
MGMSVMHRRALGGYAAAAALAALLTSCGTEYAEQFGLSPTPQGVREIRIAGCPPYAWSIQLSVAGEPNQVLWVLAPLKDRATNLPKRFLIGSVPDQWKEVVSLRRGLASGVEYQITLSSGEPYAVSLDFSQEALRSGYILDFAGNMIPISRFPLRTTCQVSRQG